MDFMVTAAEALAEVLVTLSTPYMFVQFKKILPRFYKYFFEIL